MPKLSAGVLLYRTGDGVVEVLIAHPGGPFWARKDDGAWSIPKGEYDEGEDPWPAARREFAEELGLAVPPGERIDLGTLKQSGGKLVTVFAVHATSTSPRHAATHSRWNGPRARARCASSPRSTGSAGSRWPPHAPNS